VNRKILLLVLAVGAVAGCNKTAAKAVVIQTAAVARRDISVVVTATGVIEPINVIEVKSKTASGQVMQMPIEIGTHVKPGDLILQIDTTTDLHTNYMQSVADMAAAQSNFDVAKAQLDREMKLFQDHVITQPELEAAQMAFANAQATLLGKKANVDLSAQKLQDARVVATVEGTIITKPVSNGQVIQAGATSVSGGTVIATMADLSLVRARALVNETDIGQVQPGQQVNVTVDAFPDQTFGGVVEKIEPQATVQQNVTMFPVLVSLNNDEGLLRPGMNGEVNIQTDERLDALAVPNDAIRSPREAAQAAALLGLNPDTVRAQMGSGRGGGRNAGGANGGGGGGGANGAAAAPGRGGQIQIARGELALPLIQGGGDPQGGRRGGGQGGFQVQVSDADCKAIDAAMKKKPATVKKLDDLRTKMRDPGADRKAMQGDMKKLYDDLGVDGRKAGACQRRAGGGGGGGGRGGRGGGAAGGAARAPGFANGARPGGGGPGGGGGAGGGAGGGTQGGGGRARSRSGLVFVQSGTTWVARNVRLGVANYDYTEVLDGLQEGDKVALLSVAALQAKRQEQNDRQKAMMGGGSPLGGSTTPQRGGGRGQ
jgi:HlyD family secretion protein